MIFNQPQDGITPHIGENGNWFLGKNDTGVRANGQTNTELVPLTILASDWNTETGEAVVNCAGISANEADQIVTLIPSVESKAACNEAVIECVAIDNNSFTLKAETVPAEDIHIYVAMEAVGSANGSSCGNSNEVYSFEDTTIGMWVDGKPIYRRVVYLPNPYYMPSGFSTITSIADLHVDTLVNLNVLHSYVPMPETYYRTGCGEEAVSFGISQDKLNLGGWTSSNKEQVVYGFIIEYTKTTDVATVNLPDETALATSYEQGVNES